MCGRSDMWGGRSDVGGRSDRCMEEVICGVEEVICGWKK